MKYFRRYITVALLIVSITAVTAGIVAVDESAKIFEMEWYHAKRNNFINWNTPSEDKPLCKHPE